MEKRAESSRPPPRRWGDGSFRFGQEGRKRRIGWREWAQGWRLTEDDRRQRCAGLVGSWARMGGQFNGLLNTMPATAGLCCAYCVRAASVRCRVDGRSGSARPRIGGQCGEAMRLLRAAARERARLPGAIRQRQFGSRGFFGGPAPR